MIIEIKELIYSKIKEDLVRHKIVEKEDENRNSYYNKSEGVEVDLRSLTQKQAEQLSKILKTCGVHGSKVLAADLENYLLAAKQGVHIVTARTCRQAAWMLEHFIKDLPHHVLFAAEEYGGRSKAAYYIGDVTYKPRVEHDDGTVTPEEAGLVLYWVEDDARRSRSISISRGDCRNRSVTDLLGYLGFDPETPELMAALREQTELFYEMREKIGLQCIAVGVGLADLDDALQKSRREEWNSWRSTRTSLDRFGQTRVVIEILHEGEKSGTSGVRGRGDRDFDAYRWHEWNLRFHTPDEDTVVRHLRADEATAEPADVDVPVHPLVPCYDLKRHLRMRVHVHNLTPYEYHKEIGGRLVLPERDWKMVNLLVDHSSRDFSDIVEGKGKSMNVLSVGPPGTGKTATAEVFAEYKGRPLYVIPCAQLGMDAATVEHNLSVVIERANRWNAVLLLDEADVYIRKRETDMGQNAIVGAFLRVLEYATCILFMTTNRGDVVDDAITSRCIARIDYDLPTEEDQARIWRILADLNNIKLSDAEIKKIVGKHRLSGRDVKNLLKLASFIVEEQGGKGRVTLEIIEYALQFKPTETYSKGSKKS